MPINLSGYLPIGSANSVSISLSNASSSTCGPLSSYGYYQSYLFTSLLQSYSVTGTLTAHVPGTT
jgi:hypothetical protein